ncbi:ABC transporter permease [Paraflavitalea soli]|uniref:ABC transporter permease n=1 Tax=Paraflavitalea soli TaxID=2315862 RepID=A0A3B7MNE9_9BACT|nr:ABC transporter permease [Paraflavitalea soli]AXY74889.1 ABC transporter permease [Paraflavitalea soli]
MFRNYFKIAWRNLLKHKAFSFINIFGLSAGLTCFLLIALFLVDELTFDGFHTQAGSLYRVVEKFTTATGKERTAGSVSFNTSAIVLKDMPEVAATSRLTTFGRVNVSAENNTTVFYNDYTTANETFFHLFDFPLLQGTREALKEPFTAAVTDKMAMKLFGRQDVLGRTIRVEDDSLPYRITAVVKIPGNSHIQFNVLFSEATSFSNPRFREFSSSDWTSTLFTTYVLLKDNKTANSTAARMGTLVMKNRPASADTRKSTFSLQPLKQIHFYPDGQDNERAQSGIMHLYVFGIVALFVLFIACINYMNLTTARFAGRSKEIAVRKVAGAMRNSLIVQFLAEALLITVIALFIALAAVQMLMPGFNAFTGKELSLDWHSDYRIWLGVLSVTALAALMAGIYPALFQSGLRPLQLLKNKLKLSHGHLSFRRVLVIFQFSISIIMMVATIIVFQQLKYVDGKDMGFNKEQLVVVDINSANVRRAATTIKNEYARLANVKNVTVTSRVPGEWKSIPQIKVSTAANPASMQDMYYIAADDQFLNTFQIKLLSGRNFLPGNELADSQYVLINATAAKSLNISQPSEQLIEIPAALFGDGLNTYDTPLRVRVIGIVNDFNFQSLREKIAPMVIGSPRLRVHRIDYFTARVNPVNMAETLKQMEGILHSIDATHLFEYNFLDKQWDLFYQEDKKREVIFLSVAFMTILIACLGLFGLATYAAEQRIKEIGIRKVLGASVSSIISMLSKDFLKLVLVAAVIAFPIAAWAMHQWLQDFAYQVGLQWWVFLVAGGAALFIALFTVSFQAIKAALSNPVKSLRSE